MTDLTIVINGGIASLDDAASHLAILDGVALDGVMLGRAAYQTPWVLADVDRRLFSDDTVALDRWDVVEAMVDYAGRQADRDVPIKSITRHMMGLFHGLPGARAWRRTLGEEARQTDAGPELIRRAAALVDLCDQVAT